MSSERQATILIIDDRPDALRFCQRLMGETYEFLHVESAIDARELLARRDDIAALILDRDFSKADPAKLLGGAQNARNEGMHILHWLKEQHPTLPVLMVTGYREQRSAVEAADLGSDYVTWEDIHADPQILRALVEKILHRHAPDDEQILARFRECGLIVASPRFAHALVALGRAIPRQAPILIQGETGTGKDTLAYAIHALSGDSSRPFINTNVASLPPGLVEAELFGYRKGAFTGATRDYAGRIRLAEGGTLFLNEVGDIPLALQVKLLSAIEDRKVSPLGDEKTYPVDFRLIAGASSDLRERIAQGGFRSDLYYRLAYHTIEIPPLRERREEIPLLVRAFLRDAGQAAGYGPATITREAMEYLCEQPWPGNVRQLRATVEKASACAVYAITLTDVREAAMTAPGIPSEPEGPPAPEEVAAGGAGPVASERTGLRPTPRVGAPDSEGAVFGKRSLGQVEDIYYHYLYRKTGGNMREMARLARVAISTVYAWRRRSQRSAEETT